MQIQAAKEGEGNLIRIALVDDDTNFHIICSRYVREFFHANNRLHELRLYSSPEMVIYDLKEGRDSDVYFLDVEMPGMNGFDSSHSACQIQTEDRVQDDQQYSAQVGRDKCEQLLQCGIHQ